MISELAAEKALDFLRESSKDFESLVEQARFKESMVKHIKALEMKKWNEQSIGAQEREAYASQRYLEAITEDAKATAVLRGCMERRDAAKTTISLYQSQVKDRA